jgi:hypothetical protein
MAASIDLAVDALLKDLTLGFRIVLKMLEAGFGIPCDIAQSRGKNQEINKDVPVLPPSSTYSFTSVVCS